MKDDLVPLHDILKEIAFLRSIRDRTDFAGFTANASDIRAASYSVLVISEAVRRIPDAWLADRPDTPWPAIRAIGNKLRHEYQRVSDAILWDIIASHIDPLQAAVEAMLASQERR